jgi:hypothetical protein
MKKLLLILLLCSGCYGTYYTTDVNRRIYYPKPTYYKPYVYKPVTTVVIKPNKIYGPKKPNKTHKPYKKPRYKKK